MQWTGQRSLNSEGYHVLWSGYSNNQPRGVESILNRQATATLQGWKPISDWTLIARFNSEYGNITVVQVYWLTETSWKEEKDSFYGQLQDTLNNVPNYDIKIVIRDMNTQVSQQCEGMQVIVGPHRCARETTDNGEWLLTFCASNGLSTENTFFNHKLIHKNTWRSQDGNTVNEVD